MIAIPYMEKPKDCWECFNSDCGHWGEHGYDKPTDCTLIEIARCGECEYADEYNHCKYSAWWNGNADFCSHGIRRKESR